MTIDYDHEDIKSGSRELLESDCREYCTDRGFTTDQKNTSIQICLNLYDSISEETSLTHIIADYQKELISAQSKLTPRCCTILSEYVTITLLQHFSLYKFAATEPRKVVKKEIEETIETIEPPPDFSTGISDKIYGYHFRISEIEKQEKDISEKFAEEVDELKSDRRTLTSQLKSLPISEADKLTLRERVKEMIKVSITSQQDLTSRMLTHEMNAGHEALIKDIEKVLIPRPTQLGAFPLRPVPSRGASREVRDLHSNISSRMTASQDTNRKSAGKNRPNKR